MPKAQVHRFSELASRKRSSEEETEFRDLGKELDRKLGSAETKLEEYVQQAVREVLGRTPPPEAFPENGIGYEILRQIRRLLEK